MAQKQRLQRVFVDTSALIAAFLSPTGAAAVLLDLYRSGQIVIVISEYVLMELERSDHLKAGIPRDRLVAFLLTDPTVLSLPTRASVQRAAQVISAKDAPILASAKTSQVDALVTWDKEFTKPDIVDYLARPVFLPGGFLAWFRATSASLL